MGNPEDLSRLPSVAGVRGQVPQKQGLKRTCASGRGTYAVDEKPHKA